MCKYKFQCDEPSRGSDSDERNETVTLTLTRPVSRCRDPDSVVLCVLATDEEDEDDIALQIHFTLLQAFCCDNDINILRLSGMRRLAQLLEDGTEDGNGNEPRDLHCILVTVSPHDVQLRLRGGDDVIYRCLMIRRVQ